MASNFRLVRVADGTEITAPADRYPFYNTAWDPHYAEELDEDGNQVLLYMTNKYVVNFPGPGAGDLGSALSRVELRTLQGDGVTWALIAQSSNMLLANFLLAILGVDYVIFAPGALRVDMVV